MSRSFGDIVKKRRSALGMTQARLAGLVGRSISTVRAWERGRTHPSDDETLGAVVAVLGITPAELVEAEMSYPGGAQVRSTSLPSVEAASGPDGRTPGPEAATPIAHAPEDGSAPAIPASAERSPSPSPTEAVSTASPPGQRVLGTGSSFTKAAEPEDGPRGVPDVAARESDSEARPGVLSEARTSVLEDGGARVLGVGTSAEALRPEPVEHLEPVEPEPVDEIEVREDMPAEGAVQPEPVAAPNEPDPFGATQVAPRPVPSRPVPSEVATALGESLRSTLALKPRPVSSEPVTSGYENYLDDPDEERRYRVRAVLTVVVMIALLIFLRWAMSGMGEAIGQLWSNFRANLKI